MSNYEFEYLIRLFRLSVYLQIIHRYYKQFGLEYSPQTLLEAGYKFKISIQYNLVRTTLIVQQKLSTKYIGPVFYRISLVSGQKEFPFENFIDGCKYCIESIITFDRL